MSLRRPALVSLVGLGLVAASHAPPKPRPPREVSGRPVAVARADRTEDAHRANNRGVALLEQYKAEEAVRAFREALRLDPKLGLAQTNLAIALLNVPDPEGADREARTALALTPDSPQAWYVRGLVARGQNRGEDAAAAFRKVLAVDAGDVGSHVNLGQLALQRRAYDAAIVEFKAALAAEPYNGTALYNLGIALTRAGRAEEGQKTLQQFQALKDGGAASMIGQNYPEQGRYAEAVVSTGLEPGLVDAATPSVRFVDATAEVLAEPVRGLGGFSKGVVPFDADADGDLDLFVFGNSGQRLLRNDGGKLVAVPQEFLVGRGAAGAVSADYDNDGRADLLVLLESGVRLYRSLAEGAFKDVTSTVGLPGERGRWGAAAFGDFDHDGDVDLFAGPSVQGAFSERKTEARLWRNQGARFEDVTEGAGLAGLAGWLLSVAPTDFDNRRDLDLLVNGRLFRNMRDHTFADVTAAVGLPTGGEPALAAVADFNKDGYSDFVLSYAANPPRMVLAESDGHDHFKVTPAPGPPGIPQLFDYDNDGLVDLLVSEAHGFHLFRNAGGTWVEALGALPAAEPSGPFAVADLDGDGDDDVFWVSDSGELHVFRNDGGNKNRSLKIRLAGLVSNRSGVGAKIELRAGSLQQKVETSAAFPPIAPADVIFGLGKREAADAVRVIWPSGTMQAETPDPKRPTFQIAELDRKPSSCPYLYAWDGSRFAFVTDFMGGGEMGYWQGPGRWNAPDPVENVRITDEELKSRDGRYELRVTNELEELLFVDHLELVTIDHPGDVEVHPNEGMVSKPPPFRLFAARDLRVPRAAVDDHGHDVAGRIARVDAAYPDDFALHRVRGYAEDHALTLDLGGGSADLLLLTGWTDYAFSSDNVAAQQAGTAMKPPALQMRGSDGRWRSVIEEIGIPVGRPQTIVVDLSGRWPSEDRHVRVVTNMRIYWDQIRVGAKASAKGTRMSTLDPTTASLRERGFSRELRVDRHGRTSYDYARVSMESPWKTFPGWYTRTGDVRELLVSSDDVFVFSRPGDEIALSFSAPPPPPPGWRRTFLLHSDGFGKEMDINSATPDSAGPLPFHGMSRYPYQAPEAYPMTEARRRLMERYNTRIVRRELPVLLSASR